MIENFSVVNNRNQVVQLNTDTWPMHEFIAEEVIRGAQRDKMQQQGEWPSFNYQGPLLLHVNGDLVCDTTEAYNTERRRVKNLLSHSPDVKQRTRTWGYVTFKYYGLNPIKNYYVMQSVELPLQALSPSIGPYQFTFKFFDPFWTDVLTGARYLI